MRNFLFAFDCYSLVKYLFALSLLCGTAWADTILIVKADGKHVVYDSSTDETTSALESDIRLRDLDAIYRERGEPRPPKPDPDDPTPPTDAYTKSVSDISKAHLESNEARALLATFDQLIKSGVTGKNLVLVLDIGIPKADESLKSNGDVVAWYSALKELGDFQLAKIKSGLASAFGLDESGLSATVQNALKSMDEGLDVAAAAQKHAQETEEIIEILEILKIVQMILDIIELISNKFGAVDPNVIDAFSRAWAWSVVSGVSS